MKNSEEIALFHVLIFLTTFFLSLFSTPFASL